MKFVIQANYVAFNLSDYAINITYSMGFESDYYYHYYHYVDIAGVVIQNFMVRTENAYDYLILINSSEFLMILSFPKLEYTLEINYII
ncbi:MAG: hypothetical protein K9W44_10730 [Candidatus Lokiarchaeota archaeon]|nr:hypothetical protein [Candidatus Harpocratesius repetitus]